MSSEQSLIAMSMKYGTESVQYFYKQGKLSEEQYQQVSTVIKSLFKIINDSQKIYNTLNETMRALKSDINTVKTEYEMANNSQAKAIDDTEKNSRTLKSAEVAYQSQKASYQNLLFQCEELEKEVSNLDQKMKDGFRFAEQKMQPTIERYTLDIQQSQALNEKTKASIENLQKALQENMQKITAIKRKNGELLEEEERLKEINLKIKDSPDHYAKSAQNLNIEIVGMQAELKELREEIDRKQKICATFKEKTDLQKVQIEKLKGEKEQLFQECQAIETEIDSTKNSTTGKQIERDQLKVDITHLSSKTAEVVKENKAQAEIMNNIRKQIQKLKRDYKKQEAYKKQQIQVIFENNMIIDKVKKEYDLVLEEIRQQQGQEKVIIQDIAVVVDKTQTVELHSANIKTKHKEIQVEIRRMETDLGELRHIVSNVQKDIKDSTAIRESMARKASVATAQVRETREQLKVKQLLILDLTKKYHETENKLADFKAFYEEVKSARNKYVNMIQNSSQDLAQVKERIKILQNELQILKNESSEKNKTIQEYNHMLQLEVHKRDQTKAKLNKYDLEKKDKKELVDQHINEIEKLNMIILSLQKDMQGLRQQYEEACENRNLTGIQLIDRNDELCILYEKSNAQQNLLRKSEVTVKDTEDKVRMIRIQISENERKIKVAQDKLAQVPTLAAKVLELQEEIKSMHIRQNELSKELEDPENKQRWRELKGEDPDEETLDGKISVIEERLNSKKEQLLEKQLILDEVTNLSQKLKKDAIDGRLSTLQVSEKVNEFQSRLRDLTRKMKATISELSMCQANSIKYQNERAELEVSYENAKKRMEEGLPPTPETEIEYLKMIRDKKRYEEEKRIRMQRQIIEQNYPPFATKTSAKQRVNSYIPDDIGLPKPYGSSAPFMFQSPGANMRHFKKPKIQEIQI